MIPEPNSKDLINLRIEQAYQTISDAEFLINNDKFRAAVNRIYYGMFYMMLALGLKYKFETSKHLQLIGWFNKQFIHAGKIDVKFGRMMKDAFKERQKSDYEILVSYTKEQVIEMLIDMKAFITEVEKFINAK
ncbi:MAG: hypothetical protein A2X08_04910 [Bacteroidetes bacterium GWA2_32_17]|nr:MAG: hypothetical protein A2X08_04910 [Bacteroidetes bacterium GWA2_32_17]